MSKRDRDRLKVLHELQKGHITQRQAGEQLHLTGRWIRELAQRISEQGDKAVIHGLVGQPSKRKIEEKIEKRAIKIIAREYEDFGPTLVQEYLERDHAIGVSRETVRQWMMRAGLWKKRRERIAEVHVWRKRRSCFGELVQWDTSEHDWLEGRGPSIYLIAMMDDATSRSVAQFAEHDSTAENMRVLWRWVEKYGRFVEGYTDRAGLFETNRPNQRDEERDGKLPETQIGRALRELGIGLILARSPQAKGRIERFFETAQDRLVKGLRKQKVCTLEGANVYLEQSYLPLWNERFTVRPANETDAHRLLGKGYELASILSHVEQRVIGQDYTIRYGGKLYQIAREQVRPRWRGQTVRVEERLDGQLVVRGSDGELRVSVCEKTEMAASLQRPKARRKPAPGPPTGGRNRWMHGFRLDDGPSLEQVIATAYQNPGSEDDTCDSQ
ncbi:MAG TPA: ISNCY family transposase [Bryobacteraceae bacterium]